MYRLVIALFALISVCHALAPSMAPSVMDTLSAVIRDCGQKAYMRDDDQMWACLKVKAISSMDGVVRDMMNEWQDRDIQITENLVLTKREDAAGRSDSTGPKNVADVIQNFLKTRTLEVRFPKDLAPSIARNIEEARGKLKKMGGSLLAGMLMMKGTIAAMALGGLALIAGKALTLSMLSLLLSVVAALKKGSSGGHDHRRSGRRADHEVTTEQQWNYDSSANSPYKAHFQQHS